MDLHGPIEDRRVQCDCGHVYDPVADGKAHDCPAASTDVEDDEHELDDCPDRGICPTHSLCDDCGQYPCRCDDMYERMKERRNGWDD